MFAICEIRRNSKNTSWIVDSFLELVRKKEGDKVGVSINGKIHTLTIKKYSPLQPFMQAASMTLCGKDIMVVVRWTRNSQWVEELTTKKDLEKKLDRAINCITVLKREQKESLKIAQIVQRDTILEVQKKLKTYFT